MFYKSIIILFHSVCAINVFHPMCQFYTLGRTYVWISHALYLQSAKKLFFIVEMPPWRRAVRRPTKGVSYLKKLQQIETHFILGNGGECANWNFFLSFFDSGNGGASIVDIVDYV